MKKYLFYVSQLYSLSILRPLQEEIRAREDECAWFFDHPEQGEQHLQEGEVQLKTVNEVKLYNPVAVFVPGNLVPDFFPGVKVQVLHGLATDQMGKKGHYRIRGFFDLYCTHGPEGTERFSALADKLGHFKVTETGWPKLDPLFFPQELTVLKSSLNLPVNKQLVLYAPTFSPSLSSANDLLPVIAKLSEAGGDHWLVKFHPKMDRKIVERYQALVGPNLTYFDCGEDVLPLLQVADVMVSDNSSISIEYQMLSKPVVAYNALVTGSHQVNIKHPEELKDALVYALSYPQKLLSVITGFVDRYHPYRDGRSSQRVLSAVDNFMESKNQDLRSKPLNLLRKFKLRKKLGYYKFS